MPVLSDAAGGVEGRSMEEGWLAPNPRIRAGTSKSSAFYPSTTLRVVPLPERCAFGEEFTQAPGRAAARARA